jgi:hypothetical protein
MDEDEYNSQSADDTSCTSESLSTGGGSTDTGIFMFKVKNTNRSANPDIDPVWEGCLSQDSASVQTAYLQIYDRDSGSWQTLSSADIRVTYCDCTEDDMTQLNPSTVTGDDKYYFPDDWVYFRVYLENPNGSLTGVFYSDWFDTDNLFIPEELWFFLVLAPFIPKLAQEFKRRLAPQLASKTR